MTIKLLNTSTSYSGINFLYFLSLSVVAGRQEENAHIIPCLGFFFFFDAITLTRKLLNRAMLLLI